MGISPGRPFDRTFTAPAPRVVKHRDPHGPKLARLIFVYPVYGHAAAPLHRKRIRSRVERSPGVLRGCAHELAVVFLAVPPSLLAEAPGEAGAGVWVAHNTIAGKNRVAQVDV